MWSLAKPPSTPHALGVLEWSYVVPEKTFFFKIPTFSRFFFGNVPKQELFIRKKCIFSGILSDGRYNILAFQLHHFHVWIDIKVQIKFIFVKRQIHFYLSRIQI